MLLQKLHSTNAQIWELEDEARSDSEDSKSLKREIDAANLRRNGMIEAIDLLLTPVWCTTGEHLPPLTESIGSACDRRSILSIRVAKLADRASVDPTQAAPAEATCRQLVDLDLAIDTATTDLLAGRRRAPTPFRYKIYGSAVT